MSRAAVAVAVGARARETRVRPQTRSTSTSTPRARTGWGAHARASSTRAQAADEGASATPSTSKRDDAANARDGARARARDLFSKASKGAAMGEEDGGEVVGKVLYKLQRARDAKAAEEAWALLNRVRADGAPVLTVKEWNFGVSAVGFSKENARERVLEIWERMCDAKARPNHVTMSVLARGLCRNHGDVRSTLARLRQGVMLGGTMDAYVLNILLLACVKDAKALQDKNRRGDARHEIIERAIADAALEVWNVGQSYHNAYTLTSVMLALRGCGQAAKAVEIFDSVVWDECAAAARVKVDTGALATGLSCCAQINGANGAYKMYMRAKAEKVLEEFSTSDANVILTACSREGDVALATNLFDAMLKGREPKPDKASLATVILTCGRAGKGEIAMEYFKRGREAGIDCDTFTINTLLDACAKSSTHVDALEVFMDAVEKQIPIDTSTITFLLASYTDSATQPGQLQSAIAVMNMGQFLNLEPTTATLNALLRICVAADDLDRGRVEFIKARERGVPASSTSVAILAQAYAIRGAVKEAMEIIRTGAELGVEIKAGIFIQCVAACKAHADGQGALMFYKAARDEYSIPPVTRLINELFDVLARGGMWKDALRVLSDDALDHVGDGERLADEDTVARLVRAFIVAGEVDQASAALELGKFLTNSPCDRASTALGIAKKVAAAKSST